MKFQLRQKLLAFGDDFTIQDETGADRFFVDGAAFSIGDKLSFQDMDGNELVRIEQRILSLKTTYRIVQGDTIVATVTKKPFTFFREVFEVEDAAPGDLDATGDFFDRDYALTRDGRTVATVSKKFFSMTDSYGVDVADGEDSVLLLAVVVVIDQVSHDEN